VSCLSSNCFHQHNPRKKLLFTNEPLWTVAIQNQLLKLWIL